MRQNLGKSLELVLKHEGGYVNLKSDPGGETNFGVTKRVYDAYRSTRGFEARSVKQITAQEVTDIYRQQYWDAVKGDKLPSGLDYAVFDYAVNSGSSKAIKDLQRCLGLKLVDGVIGVGTLSACQEADPVDLITALCNRRLAFMKGLKTWKTFGKGWTRRVMGATDGYQKSDTGVIDHAINMAEGGRTALPMPLMAVSGKADEAGKSRLKTPEGAGAGMVGAGVVGQGLKETAAEFQPMDADNGVSRTIMIVCLIVSFIGTCLVAYAMYKRVKEAGGSLKDIFS